MIEGYSILYALKEKEKLKEIFKSLSEQKKVIDDWFTDFGKSYSNSVLSKAPYYSDIRKPYNEKFDEYSVLMREYRVVSYYLELLDQ